MNLKSLFSLCVTQLLSALSQKAEKTIYTYLFLREMGRRKRAKRNPVTEKGT